MINLAIHVLQTFGVKYDDIENHLDPELEDPTTEEQFKKIKFKSETPITWEMYKKAEQETIPKLHESQKQIAKQLCQDQCKKILEETDYLMTMDRFSELENGQEWIAYRKLLRNLPDTIDYDSLRISVTQLDFQKVTPPPQPPKIKKTS